MITLHSRNPFKQLAVLLCMGMLVMPLSLSAESHLDNQFARLESKIDTIVRAVTKHQFGEAEQAGAQLIQLTSALQNSEVPANNTGWHYYSSNMHNHANELLQAIQTEDMVDGIYLIATMTHHIGELQATIPYWLRDHLQQQLAMLKQGILLHDSEMVRNAAEIIHISSSKLQMSATSRPDVYTHIRWVSSVASINQLGDQIIPMSEAGYWEQIADNTREIEFLLQRWFDSFKPQDEEK